MEILIAGASGFIGSELVSALKNEHTITVLGRDMQRLNHMFSNEINKITWDDLSNLDGKKFAVVINLCGSNIGAKKWTPTIKKELIDSRVVSNQKLITWLLESNAKPRYLCANAVGIYGLQDNADQTAFDEDTIINFDVAKDFLNEIGITWQQSLSTIISNGFPTLSLRFGVVLQRHQGMLKKLELPYYFCLGSVLGDGNQVISWVHIKDVIASIQFILNQPGLTGAINITAPNPVKQKTFAKVFATVLRRPLLLTMPASVIKLLFGEMGECLLLKGQRVLPKKLHELGYQFHYPTLELALKAEYP